MVAMTLAPLHSALPFRWGGTYCLPDYWHVRVPRFPSRAEVHPNSPDSTVTAICFAGRACAMRRSGVTMLRRCLHRCSFDSPLVSLPPSRRYTSAPRADVFAMGHVTVSATVSSAAHRLRGMVLLECQHWFAFHPCIIWPLRVPRFSSPLCDGRSLSACLSLISRMAGG